MKRLVLAGLLIMSIFSLNAQTQVEPFVPGSTLDGICYYLPSTALRVTVVAEKTITNPGDFWVYADKYFRLKNVPQSQSVNWTIKSITLEPFGVPDKSKAYSIKLKSKTLAPLVGLSKDGILLSINTDVQEETLPPLPEAVPAPALVNPRNFMTQEILSAGADWKMAELCAQEIYDIRESRNDLIRGEADNTPKDGAQLKLMLEQLSEQEKALESLFSGTQQTSTEVFSLNYVPTKETDKEILFRFSQKLGLVDADDLAGDPVYVSIKSMETLPQAVQDEGVAKKKEKMEKGVYYNVPARMAVTVFNAHQEFTKMETPMGQFGVVEILSNLLFDKKTNTQVTFFQSTGGTKDVME